MSEMSGFARHVASPTASVTTESRTEEIRKATATPPARTNGHEPTLEGRLFDQACEFDFFQSVCLLERLWPNRRPVGREGSQGAEVARFRVMNSLCFPASSIHEIVRRDDPELPPDVIVSFMGLTGPSGVLPRHYTELLIRLERELKGPERYALRDWLDLFNHRLISLFYRAWEKYRFYVPYWRGEYARPEPDTFTEAVFSLMGMGTPGLRNRLRVSTFGKDETKQQLARIEDLSLLYYSGLFARRPRSAINLEVILSDYFQVPVRVHQFQGQWLRLEKANCSRLGVADGNNSLGADVVAGERVWDVQGKVRICLGPLRYEQFLEFFPCREPDRIRKAFFLLGQLARLYLGPEFDFDVQLVLHAEDVPECRLTSQQSTGPHLGWNTWLHSLPCSRDAEDAVFTGEATTWLDPAPVRAGMPL